MTRAVTGQGIIRNGVEYNCSHCTHYDNNRYCTKYKHFPIWYTGCSGINIGTHSSDLLDTLKVRN